MLKYDIKFSIMILLIRSLYFGREIAQHSSTNLQYQISNLLLRFETGFVHKSKQASLTVMMNHNNALAMHLLLKPPCSNKDGCIPGIVVPYFSKNPFDFVLGQYNKILKFFAF